MPFICALLWRCTGLPAWTPATFLALMSAWMSEDLRIALLDLPVVGEAVPLVVLLRRAILVRAVPGIVVLEEGHRLVLPGMRVGVVADHADTGTKSVPSGVVALVVPQREQGGEVEHAAGGFQATRDRGRMPDPAALCGMGTPIVLADREGGIGCAVVRRNPFGVETVHHVITPPTVACTLQLEQVANYVAAYPFIRVIDVPERVVLVGRPAMLGVLDRPFLLGASLIDWRIEDFGVLVRERFIISCDRPSAPVGVPEVRPALGAVAMIDDDIGDRLDPIAEQRSQHRAVLSEIAIAVCQVEVFLGVVSCAECARERGRRQPDQVEPSLTYPRRLFSDDLVPGLRTEARKLLRMSVSVRLPIKSLQHDPIVIEPGLRV